MIAEATKTAPQADEIADFEAEQRQITESAVKPGQFHVGDPRCGTERPTTQLREARQLQRVAFSRAQEAGIKPVESSAFMRAWCDLQESIRKLRGIPLPGQLRPDLVPGKRGKREPILNAQSFSEAVEVPKSPDPDPK